MANSSTSTTDPNFCSICLEFVADNCGRSTAKLQCGHLFHLDCIGSEFNKKGAMQCPNCRATENGQWLYAGGGLQQSINNEDNDNELHYYELAYGHHSSHFHGIDGVLPNDEELLGAETLSDSAASDPFNVANGPELVMDPNLHNFWVAQQGRAQRGPVNPVAYTSSTSYSVIRTPSFRIVSRRTISTYPSPATVPSFNYLANPGGSSDYSSRNGQLQEHSNSMSSVMCPCEAISQRNGTNSAWPGPVSSSQADDSITLLDFFGDNGSSEVHLQPTSTTSSRNAQIIEDTPSQMEVDGSGYTLYQFL